GLVWSEDGTQLGFQWAKADGAKFPAYKSYIVNEDGTGLKEGRVSPKKTEPWDTGSKVGYQIAYESGGDIFIRDTFANSSENITKSSDAFGRPTLTTDAKSVIFQRDQDLFRYSLETKKTDRLTQVKADPASTVPITLTGPAGYSAGVLLASPSGTHVAALMFKGGGTSRSAQVARFITSSGYVELTGTYPRVGNPQSHSMAKIYNIKTGKSIDVETPRPGSVSPIDWAPDGKHGVMWSFSENHKDAWLYGFNTETEKVTMLYDEHDDAWVGGPGLGTVGWLPDSSAVYFESENSGFANLMEVDPETARVDPIVAGPFEVSNVQLDKEHERFTFVSSEGSHYERHIDSVGLKGGTRTKLADLSADEDATYAFSPDGFRVAVVRSHANRPAELFVKGVQVTTTPTAEWLAAPWIDPPIISVPSRDGKQIPAKLFQPKNWRKGGPAVVFVHGAGYLQNVYDGWSHYFREYMFHHVLMENGYAVLDVDYRASAGYGKAWRTAIYRHMGGKDLDDVVDGANYLVKTVGAAPDRLGVYGGSYGGFITFMAMFTAPDVFKSGAALRPVGDWANYHHDYTSPILNTPKEDPEAYKLSSPINFVDGFKGHLLICHGMVDVNVQFQDSIRIVQKLIELGKKNWEVAPYPVEDHSFVQPESWTDEYRRIFGLFERTIGNKRQPGGS
ncbi:MAG: prolyl oligopeptidase family serine peptidase, partial [Armatimonadota bacterium]